MQSEYTNIYQTARNACGLTQERAAELLWLSVESVKAYERDVTFPKDTTVLRMVDIYSAPFLVVQHLRASTELARSIIPQISETNYTHAVIRLLNRNRDFSDKLKESGVEIPSRMLDVVAEAMQISATRLARLDVIRKNLCAEAMSMFIKNTINESVAYELAQAPDETQEKMLSSSKEPGKMTAWQIKDRIGWLDKISKIKCKNGAECINRERMFTEKCKDSNRCSYLECVQNGKCFKDCLKLYTSSSACNLMADRIKKHKAKEKKQRTNEKSEAENKKLNQITENNKQWLRLGYARQRAGVSYEEISSALKDAQCYSFPSKSAVEKFESCECDDSYYASLLNHLTGFQFAVLAKLYGRSADYLLGLTEGLNCVAAHAGWRDYPVDPPQDGQHIITLTRLPTLELEIGQAICRDEKLFIYRPGTEDCSINNDNILGWMPFSEV